MTTSPARRPAGRFRTVIFDCDSTLCSIEGVDELASGRPGLRDEIAQLTDAAMRGDVPLEDVYGLRLQLVKPTRTQLDRLGQRYIESLVPDAPEVVTALRENGIEVRIISGGMRLAVLAVARTLGVDEALVRAVDIRFEADGSYAGFDSASPLTRSGGKRLVVEQWDPPIARPAMLVGDGMTDLEARPALDYFVAFAGVIERKHVIEAADAVITTTSLAPVLPLALGTGSHDPRTDALYDKGRSLLDLAAAATHMETDR